MSVQPRTLWVDSIQVEPAFGWMRDSPDPTSPVRAGEPLDPGTPQGGSRRLWYPKRAQGGECHTWLGYHTSENRHAKHEKSCLPVVMQGGPRFPVPAAPSSFGGPRLQDGGTFSRPPSLNPGDEHTECKLGGQSGRQSKPTPAALVKTMSQKGQKQASKKTL
ncbi:hypothetical protein GWK47_053387 [Chionoecetes opilio]|uniref:Uncharacterized protein n=1 Tax=Chionoecetes opilio TaxID=41210 RepID=A0A8J4Y0Q4_CHIOP|nr:hypothetical protein GWK47_053387 [Chionoecetes opilio]